MNPDELRALADALEPMAKAPRFEDMDVPAFCRWLRAQADAQPVAVPAGWKLVPVEPTPEMLSAVGMMDGYDWHAPGCSPDADHANWYSAMIAAAPAAPQAEPKREHWNNYFAAKAMQSILLAAMRVAGSESRVDFAAVAAAAYRMAAEMVKARETE